MLLRVMISMAELYRWVAVGFARARCRWPAHVDRCGALIVAALGYARARRHRCDKRLVVALRAAGRVLPSHSAQTSAKDHGDPASRAPTGRGTPVTVGGPESEVHLRAELKIRIQSPLGESLRTIGSGAGAFVRVLLWALLARAFLLRPRSSNRVGSDDQSAEGARVPLNVHRGTLISIKFGSPRSADHFHSYSLWAIE